MKLSVIFCEGCERDTEVGKCCEVSPQEGSERREL